MLASFLRHYLELPQKNKNIAFLGGGVGTAQLLKGLRDSQYNLTAIVSMADDGGSAGRLRRAFSVPPPGDLVNCLAALSAEESILKSLLLYRFAGKRYGKDTDLGGHKLGNLIFVALTDLYKGDMNMAIEAFSKIISTKGRVLPATVGDLNIWAVNKQGKKVYGEQNIDLGKYNGAKTLKEVHLDPENVKAYKGAVDAVSEAQVLVIGPGDLFTTVLPVLIVNQIKKEIRKSKALKILVVNIANKPYETFGFKVSDYINTVNSHLGENVFDKVLVNNYFAPEIPKDIKYKYVEIDHEKLKGMRGRIIEGDFLDENFPVYHDSAKIAAAIDKLSG